MRPSIQDIPLHDTTKTRYLNYALSVITARALPDVRDGLKPVQRRILYAMYHNLHLTAEAKHRKSAAVIGEVMAKYHPHGDQSIYDALVRMAQPFSLRYPMVDGQGNFGSLDGDNAAAMRYTEARLQHIAEELLVELKKETVDFRPNYDGTYFEPITLPAQVPNLLINGAAGIAVGMATNIPPHNLKEVINGLLALIDDPKIALEEIVKKHIKGPDFPSGGEILTPREELLEIYRTGSGSVDTRGIYELESEGHRKRIIISSIPYGVNKANLVAEIANYIRTNKLPQLVDIRDESTEEMRIVLDLKRGADPEAAMAFLYRKTRLQNRFSVNMTALFPIAGSQVPQPRKKGLLEVLKAFLDFRFSVTERRLQYDLKRLRERIHILEAFELLFDALDEAIGLIRESEGKADARDRLRLRFEFDHEQAEAILETKLYRLARLEIDSIRQELAEKRQEASELEKVLGSKKLMWGLIRSELSQIADAYGDRRRSKITGPVELQSFSAEDYIVSEDSFVIVTSEGLFKRQKSYSDLSAIRVREGDAVKWLFPSRTTESLILFTDRGRAYTVRVHDIPQTTGYGEHLQTRFEFSDGETVVGAITTDPRCLPEVSLLEEAEPLDTLIEEGAEEGNEPAEAAEGETEATDPKPQQKVPLLLGITRGGRCLRFDLSPYAERSTVNGRRYMKLNSKVKDDAVVRVLISSGDEIVSLASRQGRCLLFPVNQVNYLTSAGMGVMAIKLSPRDSVIGFALSSHRMEGLEVETSRGRREVLRPNKFKVTKRGGKGREIIKRGHLTQAIFPVVEIICETQEEELAQEEMEDSVASEADSETEGMKPDEGMEPGEGVEPEITEEEPPGEDENNPEEDSDTQGSLFDNMDSDKE